MIRFQLRFLLESPRDGRVLGAQHRLRHDVFALVSEHAVRNLTAILLVLFLPFLVFALQLHLLAHIHDGLGHRVIAVLCRVAADIVLEELEVRSRHLASCRFLCRLVCPELQQVILLADFIGSFTLVLRWERGMHVAGVCLGVGLELDFLGGIVVLRVVPIAEGSLHDRLGLLHDRLRVAEVTKVAELRDEDVRALVGILGRLQVGDYIDALLGLFERVGYCLRRLSELGWLEEIVRR